MFQFVIHFNVMMVPTVQEKDLLNQVVDEGQSFKKHGNCQNKVGTKVRQNTNSDTMYYGNQENKRKKANSNIFKFKNIPH